LTAKRHSLNGQWKTTIRRKEENGEHKHIQFRLDHLEACDLDRKGKRGRGPTTMSRSYCIPTYVLRQREPVTVDTNPPRQRDQSRMSKLGENLGGIILSSLFGQPSLKKSRRKSKSFKRTERKKPDRPSKRCRPGGKWDLFGMRILEKHSGTNRLTWTTASRLLNGGIGSRDKSGPLVQYSLAWEKEAAQSRL